MMWVLRVASRCAVLVDTAFRGTPLVDTAFRCAPLVVALGVAACAAPPFVERAYDGRVVEGRWIEPDAYAAFLNGAMAEASGNGRDALTNYGQAARLDPASPEIWARLGAVRCSLDPRDFHADEAFAHALAIAPGYAAAWVAKARCAAARKNEAVELDAARHAAALDASADGLGVLLARAAAASPETLSDAATRDALVALTATARDPVSAWDALATWAESRGDVALWSVALESVVKIAPARRDAVARAAENLAGAGQLGSARAVAAAATDAGNGPLAPGHPLAARLALDEAIERGDLGLARLRTTRARLGLDEAGARACLEGRRDIGRELVGTLVHADPGAAGARLVLAACDEKSVLAGVAAEARRGGMRASAAGKVVFGTALLRAISPSDARATLAAIGAEPIVAGDDRVARAAVILVSRGVLDAGALSADGLVELAVLGAATSKEGLSLPDVRTLDERHEYLARALSDPSGARTGELGAQLATVAPTDAVVAAASALVQIAGGGAFDAGAARALLARDPTDPLLAAVALRIANRTGDADSATRARAMLTALGGVEPHEGEATKKSGATF